MKTALWKPGINFLCTHPGISTSQGLFPGFCLPPCLPGYIFPQMMRRWTQDPIQKQPGVRGPLRWQLRNFDPGAPCTPKPSVSDFSHFHWKRWLACGGNIKCYHGCHSCAPLFPVAVEIHWEISREIVQNAVVGWILTLATAGAKTSGKARILLVSCCQVGEKKQTSSPSKRHSEMESQGLLMQGQAPWKPFVWLWQFHTPPCLFLRSLESFLGGEASDEECRTVLTNRTPFSLQFNTYL